MTYQLIEDLQMKAVTVSQACRILEVSRSGYYAAAKRHSTAPVVCAASVHLKAAFAASGRTYGSRRLRAAVHMSGVTMGRHKVRSPMRLNGLHPVWKRKFVHTNDSKHTLPVSPNVLARQFEKPLPNQAWVSDITYIQTHSGWLYLAAVLDLHSRKIVGWLNGARDACNAGLHRLANGYRAAQPHCRSGSAFRPGNAVRQRDASRVAEEIWIGRQHERQRQLLG